MVSVKTVELVKALEETVTSENWLGEQAEESVEETAQKREKGPEGLNCPPGSLYLQGARQLLFSPGAAVCGLKALVARGDGYYRGCIGVAISDNIIKCSSKAI